MHLVVKEVESGDNASRPKFLNLLADPTMGNGVQNGAFEAPVFRVGINEGGLLNRLGSAARHAGQAPGCRSADRSGDSRGRQSFR